MDLEVTEEQLVRFLEENEFPEDQLVFLQPINGLLDINRIHMDRVTMLCPKHPTWRISLQLHKILGVR